MKILTGYHFPTDGEARVDGVSVTEDPVAVKSRIGYLPEGVPLYGELTVDEYLRFAADVRQIPVNDRKKRIAEAVDACGLSQMRGRRIEALSKGYKQRTGLAQAILHDPPILILDEPTTGLDPNQIIEIRSLIKELGKRKTVILSTHILQEVEAVCGEVLILNEGRIAAQGTPAEIALTMRGGTSWELRLKAAKSAVDTALSTLSGGIERVKTDSLGDGVVSVSFFTGAAANAAAPGMGEQIFDWVCANGFKILKMNEAKLSLEDIFVRLTGATGGTHEV
jgi:ABC-2 type transport system ATP-binding protein